jgi:hypothetical protein
MCARAHRRGLMAWISPSRRPGRRAAAVTAPPTAMLLNGAADMTGSTVAVILIPPAGTICLLAWLAVVFYAGRDHPHGPDPTRRLAAQAPARPRWLPGARQTPAQRIGARGGDSGPVRQPRRLASSGPGTTIAAAPSLESSRPRPGQEIMHPMSVKLFPQAGAGDLLADEQDEQRAANRAGRH